MTKNYEWLNKMAMSDLLNLIITNSSQCFIELLGKNGCGRCKQFYKEGMDLDDMCRECMYHWLNEKI